MPHQKEDKNQNKTKTFFQGPQSSELLEIQLKVMSDEDCQKKYEPFRNVKINNKKLCAYDPGEIKDACQGKLTKRTINMSRSWLRRISSSFPGDSGGPMMFSHGPSIDMKWYLIGVVSFGYKCAVPGFPGVYTRVSAHSRWILDNLNDPLIDATEV